VTAFAAVYGWLASCTLNVFCLANDKSASRLEMRSSRRRALKLAVTWAKRIREDAFLLLYGCRQYDVAQQARPSMQFGRAIPTTDVLNNRWSESPADSEDGIAASTLEQARESRP